MRPWGRRRCWPDVPGQIATALFPELGMYGFRLLEGRFAELLGSLEEDGATDSSGRRLGRRTSPEERRADRALALVAPFPDVSQGSVTEMVVGGADRRGNKHPPRMAIRQYSP